MVKAEGVALSEGCEVLAKASVAYIELVGKATLVEGGGETADGCENLMFGLSEEDVSFEHPAFESGSVGGGSEGCTCGCRAESVEPRNSAVEEVAGDHLVKKREAKGCIVNVVLVVLWWRNLLPEVDE